MIESWRHLPLDMSLATPHCSLRKVRTPLYSVFIITSDPILLDHPYVIAFSLIMLHTDAFNKSNKRKMTKADYVKNTQLPGVYPQVLDVSVEITLDFMTMGSFSFSVSTTTSFSLLSFLWRILWKSQGLSQLACLLLFLRTLSFLDEVIR